MEQENRAKIEDDELITDIIKRNYYNVFLQENSPKHLELIINRKNINSKCYGCFNNTETEMYPHIDFTENNYDKIYENFTAILKYYDKNNWHCPIEINGVDWSNSENCERFLILLQNLANRTSVNFPKKIIINTDFKEFIDNGNDLNKRWRRRYEAFKKQGINLFFNIHANGLYCDDNGFDEKFYNTLLFWINSYHLDLHSIKIISYIRPSNVKNWIKNYDWWLKSLGDLAFNIIELREEKTENWTYDLIAEYNLFLKHQIEILINKFPSEFESIIFDNKKDFTFQNISILENRYLINDKKNNNCNFFKNLTIDLTTMNIVPCAKINYEDFACGQYIIKNNEIASIRAKNIPIIIFNTHLKQSCMPHCENCCHIEFCSGHCLGESYNKCYDPLVPIREFCDLSKTKINFLIYVYSTLGLLTKDKLKNANKNKLYINSLLELQETIMGGLN